MSGRKVIRGGRVLQASGGAPPQDILIEDGRIVAIDNPGICGLPKMPS